MRDALASGQLVIVNTEGEFWLLGGIRGGGRGRPVHGPLGDGQGRCRRRFDEGSVTRNGHRTGGGFLQGSGSIQMIRILQLYKWRKEKPRK